MDDEDILHWADTMSQMARFNFQKCGHLVPVLAVLHKNEIMIIGCPFKNQDEKVMASQTLKSQLRGMDVDATVYICEAHYASVDAKEKDKIGTVPVKDMPGARQVISILLEYKNGVKQMFIPILENKELGEAKWIDADRSVGLFSGFVNKEWDRGYS